MKVTFSENLPEINEEPVKSEVKKVECTSCGNELGHLIILPEVDRFQKVKCICPCGGESFVFPIKGQVHLDFPYGIKDTDIENEVMLVWLN